MVEARTPLASHETIFTVMADTARHMSRRQLGTVALVSGVVALIATMLGRNWWILFAACYAVWDFATWGLLFSRPHPASQPSRALEYFVIVSGSAAAIAVGVGLFFLALGPHWQL